VSRRDFFFAPGKCCFFSFFIGNFLADYSGIGGEGDGLDGGEGRAMGSIEEDVGEERMWEIAFIMERDGWGGERRGRGPLPRPKKRLRGM
jgi:hypothetical protein